jgi:hypothetical protein
MKPRRIATVLAVLATVSWTAPARSQSLGLYDTFASGQIDPLRWRGYEYVIDGTSSRTVALNGGVSDAPVSSGESFFGPRAAVESRRGVVGGQAQIAVTAYKRGGYMPSYTPGKGRSGLRINHPGLADHSPLITTFRTSVTVAGVSVAPTDPDAGSCGDWGNAARAQLFGHFFNDGSSVGPQDLTGDVFAAVSLERRVELTSSGSTVMRDVVEARVGRCNTPQCRMTWSTTVFTRGWTVGAAHVLTINWRPGSNAFTFTVSGGGITTESRTVTYSRADSTPPRGYAYDLRVEAEPGFCGDGEEVVPATASIDARFDNVQLDSTAATAAR